MCSKLTKLIIVAHPLEIETGWYSKPCIPPKLSRFSFTFCKRNIKNEMSKILRYKKRRIILICNLKYLQYIYNIKE